MERTPVSSSSIASIGYDDGRAVLEIEFHGGMVYQYFDVPAAEAEAMLSAGSVGRYFLEQVKGTYRYARI